MKTTIGELAALLRAVENPMLYHVVVLVNRPETLRFSLSICDEPYAHEVRYCELEWRGLSWIIFTAPIDRRDALAALAARLSLRLADGVPHIMVDQDGIEILGSRRPHSTKHGMTVRSVFPMSSDRVVTLERAHATRGPIAAGIAHIKKEKGTPR